MDKCSKCGKIVDDVEKIRNGYPPRFVTLIDSGEIQYMCIECYEKWVKKREKKQFKGLKKIIRNKLKTMDKDYGLSCMYDLNKISNELRDEIIQWFDDKGYFD